MQEAYSKESAMIQVHAFIRFLDVWASGTQCMRPGRPRLGRSCQSAQSCGPLGILERQGFGMTITELQQGDLSLLSAKTKVGVAV